MAAGLKRFVRTALTTAAATACGAAHADPVIVGSVAVSLIGDAAATWLVQNAVLVAMTGYSLFSAAQQRRKQRKQAAAARAAALAGLSDRTANLIDTEAAPQVVYGAPAPVGCSIVAFLNSGDHDELNHLVCVFAGHPCEAIDEIYIDGVPVGTIGADGWAAGTNGGFVERSSDKTATFDVVYDAAGRAVLSAIEVVELLAASSGAPTVTIVNGSTVLADTPGASASVTVRYRTVRAFVNVQKHLSPGGVDSADAYLMARRPDLWTANHKLSGYTYAVVTLHLAFSRFQGGRPQITARLRGKNTIYDWRTGTTGYSRNPALCLADFIRSEPGYQSTADQVDAASVIAAANACDVPAYAASNWAYDLFNFGGSPALYVCDGAFRTDQDRETTRQQLEDTMCGNSHQSGGVWRVMAGAWSTPVMALTDDDLLASIEVKQAGNPTNARYNGARVTYLNAAGLGATSDEIPPYSNAAYLAEDGRPKVQDIQLAFVGSWARAVQVARVRTAMSRAGMTLVVRPKMKAWRLQPGDRLQLTNGLYNFAGKNFRLADWSHSTTSPVAFELVEDEPVLYSIADGIGDPAPNTAYTDPFAAPAQAVLVGIHSGTAELLLQGGATVVRVRVQWQGSTETYVLNGGRVELDWRPAFASEADWKSSVQAADATSAFLLGLPEGGQVLVRVRFVSALGRPGPYAIALHAVLGKTEPPPQVGSVALATDRVFFAELSRDAVPDLAGYLIRVVPGTEAVWSLGVPLHQGMVTDSPWLLPLRLYGVQTVMVAAVDDSGNVGAAGAATQDFGQPKVSTAVQKLDIAAAGWPERVSQEALAPGLYPYGVGEVRRFARASLASFVNLQGRLELAPADQPRIGYIGRLTAPGGGKNLLARSNEFEHASYGGYFGKPAVSLVTAPDGSQTARRMASTDAGPGPAYSGLIAWRALPDGDYCVSAWLRCTQGQLEMQLAMGDGTGATVTIDTTWRRYGVAVQGFSSTAVGNRMFQIFENTPGNAAWDIWHAQVEPGVTVSDYIANDGDAVAVRPHAVVFDAPRLLIEPAAANLWPYSTRLSDQWQQAVNAAQFVEGMPAPDGSSTATRILPSQVYSEHYVQRQEWGAGLQTFSVFVKPAGLSRVALLAYSLQTNAYANAAFDLLAGVVANQAGTMLRAAAMEPLAEGWWRISLSFDNSAGADAAGAQCRLALIDGASSVWLGDGYGGVDAWGVNLVPGALSSYIHQPAMSARAADSADVNSIAAGDTSYNWELTGGAVRAIADSQADFWALGTDFWVRDVAADFWGGSSYLPLIYTAGFVPAYGGGAILLELQTEGRRTTVDYRVDGSERGNYWADRADFWTGAGDLWGGVNAWQPWLGEAISSRGMGVQFRVSIDGGPLQGAITAMKVSLVMPLVQQVFAAQQIAAGGTRLTPSAGLPARRWISLTNVALTPVADGSGAVTGRIKTFDPDLGAEVELLGSTGAPVTGTATAVQYGYEDTTA